MILAIKKYKVDSFISKYLSYQLEIFCIYLSLNISGYCTFSSNNLCWDVFYYVTFSPSRSVRCETNKPPAMRVRVEGYTKKTPNAIQ